MTDKAKVVRFHKDLPVLTEDEWELFHRITHGAGMILLRGKVHGEPAGLICQVEGGEDGGLVVTPLAKLLTPVDLRNLENARGEPLPD